jgi:hypothetical protein
MRRISAIVLVALALLVSGLTLTSAEATSSETLRFVAKSDQLAEIDLGKKGPSLGDKFVFSDNLSSRHDRDAGELNGECTATHLKGKAATMQCLVTASLDDGDVTTQGVVQSNRRRATLAVTGGTGDYTGASGEVRVRFVSDTKSIIKLYLD